MREGNRVSDEELGRVCAIAEKMEGLFSPVHGETILGNSLALDLRASRLEAAFWKVSAEGEHKLRCAEREITRASAESPGWQPISTAPRDATLVLLGCYPHPPASVGDEIIVIAGWYESGIADRRWYDVYHSPVRPTHWMPLPAAPGIADPATSL